LLRPPASTLTLLPPRAQPRKRVPSVRVPAIPARVRRFCAGLLYGGLCIAPLALISHGWQAQPRRPFVIELSVAVGYLGLSLLVLQFLLTSRREVLAKPFGWGPRIRFHRRMAVVTLLFLAAHPALLLYQDWENYIGLFDPMQAPWRARFGVGSLLALTCLFLLAWGRKRLHLSPTAFRRLHGWAAMLGVTLALAHLAGVGHYGSSYGGQALMLLCGAAMLGFAVHGLRGISWGKPRTVRRKVQAWSAPAVLALFLLGACVAFAALHAWT
jgi:predicted ferric reductase